MTGRTTYDRGHAVIEHALAGDETGLTALLATLDAPQLRRVLRTTVLALADTVAGRCESAGVPRREAAEWFAKTKPRPHTRT